MPSRTNPGAGGGARRRRGGRSSSGPASKPHASRIEPLHPSETPPEILSFREWDLGEPIQAAIAAMGIQVPTPIQRLAIGPVLEGRDVIAKAETGTGKTLAFGAPIMARIDPERSSVLALALCPTRELAQQVAGVLEKLGEARGIRVALVVGGEPMHAQVEALKGGAQVVVGTPGRVLDLYGQRFLSFPWTEYVVLDEADEMLEIGFIDDVKKILSFTPEERHTLHFSATFPHDVLQLARESTRNPVEIATAAGLATVDTIEQSWMEVDRTDRPLALTRMIEQSDPDDVFLVFCDRRTEVDSLMRQLSRMPFSIKALHGGYDQPSRFRVMSAFRTGEVKALVATDVASRGLDVAHVTHVVNYSVPQDVKDYTHRIGRTGRAGRSGKSFTFVTSETAGRWRQIQAGATWSIAQVELPGRSGGRPSARNEAPKSRDSERAPGADRASAPRERSPRERSGRERAPREHAARERAPRREHRERPARPEPAERAAAAPPATAKPALERSPGTEAPARDRRPMTTRERLALERAHRARAADAVARGAGESDAPPAIPAREHRPRGDKHERPAPRAARHEGPPPRHRSRGLRPDHAKAQGPRGKSERPGSSARPAGGFGDGV